MKTKIITTLLAFSALSYSAVSFSAGPPSRGASKPIPVVAEQVNSHSVSQSLTLIGKLTAQQSVIISPEVGGVVDRILVKRNQSVKQNDLLLTLKDNKACASVIEANAYLNDEKRKLLEFERLVKRNAITQTALDAQKASVEIAQARLKMAKAELDYMHIRAPFAGNIGFIDFSRGKMVTAGSELLTLDNLNVMQLDLQVPERYLSKLSKGMTVLANTSAWGHKVFTGTVVGIDSRINPETLNMRVRIHFQNAQRELKPGMLLSAKLTFPAIEAPFISVQALEYSGTKRYVYLIEKDNTVVRKEVILGARIDNKVVIEEGLAIGDKIVVQGTVNMRNGAKVVELTVDGKPVAKSRADQKVKKPASKENN